MPDVTEEQTYRDQFLADLQKRSELPGPDWLQTIREEGYARFTDTPFPHHKMEAWRFTPVKPIVKTAWATPVGQSAAAAPKDAVAKHLYHEAAWAELVFVDGLFSAELSRIPDGLAVAPGSLAEAIAAGNATVKEHLEQTVTHTSAFTTLNSALIQDGLFLHVPKNTQVEAPIHVVFACTAANNPVAHPRNLIVLDESAELTLLETYVGLGDSPYFTNGVSEIVIGDNAKLTRYKVVEESPSAYHLCTDNVVQGRDSRHNSFAITLTGQIVRNELRVLLNGEGANCELDGLYLNEGERVIDNALAVRHAKSNCYSRMGYKGILDDKSSAVFTGKVDVDRDSQNTDSNQLNNNLLLSDDATIDTKPQLEIYADNVKCTHGATVGGFPPELIFYFRSRGMSPDMAHGILTYGFADAVVDEIEVGPLHDRLDRYIFDKYSPNPQ